MPDDITFAYFYNPFTGDTFQAALNGLIESLDRRPRELTLIYCNPVMADAVDASGRFVRARQLPAHEKRLERTIAVYKSRPRATAARDGAETSRSSSIC